MDFIFLILCTLCIIIVFKIVSILHHQYIIRRKFKRIPQDDGYPFIGVAFKLIKMKEYERLQYYRKFAHTCKEGIFIQWIGVEPFVNIFKPEYLEIIFPSTVNIKKGIPYEMLSLWLGKGLLTSTGAQWFHDRKLITPTFHFSILEQFAIVLSEKTEILVKCLEKEIAKNPTKAIDIFPFALNVALDIICETAMGVNIHAQEQETKYTSAVQRSSRLTMERIFRPWIWIDWLYFLTPAGKEYKSVLNKLHGFTEEVIRKKKAARQLKKDCAQSENEENDLDISKPKRKAFLDLLLDQNEKDDTPLTDEQLRSQVDTFMFEGHDTTAVAITWGLFLLGNNLEQQEKVHEELEEVFKDSQRPANVKELSQLKYLDRVIKETLRLFPSVPLISRQLMEDVKLGNYTIPKNNTVALALTLAHMNPDVWPEPMKFDPDRFLPENTKDRHPYAYIPFSAGPRNCIGQRLALLEEKTVLTAVLRKWRVKSVKPYETIKYAGSLILRPCEKVLLHFTPK